MYSKDNRLTPKEKLSLLFALMAAGRIEGLAAFGEIYEKIIYQAVIKLTGIDDPKALETTVVAILVSIWRNSKSLLIDRHPSILIYKFILLHVFKLLENEGRHDRIQLIKTTYPMNSSAFESFPFK